LDAAGTYHVLHTFTGPLQPNSGVVRDATGNLYGSGNAGSLSFVYEVDTAGDYNVLYSFPKGVNTSPDVIVGPTGDLYGTAGGQTLLGGVIYKLPLP